MLLPEPDGPTMKANRPLGIRQLTPRTASTTRSPLRNDFRTSTTSIMGILGEGAGPSPGRPIDQCDPTRMASIGTSRAARHAG